jgi:hypothetical protein
MEIVSPYFAANSVSTFDDVFELLATTMAKKVATGRHSHIRYITFQLRVATA